jgi:hypothetical protein
VGETFVAKRKKRKAKGKAKREAGQRSRPGAPAAWATRAYLRTNLILVAAFVAIAFLFRALSVPDTAEIFPLSMFFGPQIAWAGLPYAAVFIVGLWLARRLELSPERVWLLGLALIVLGNLAQGGFHVGIVRPVYIWDRQYYNEAVRIGDWRVWLSSFTEIQETLNAHAQTHPPFAVLLHYMIGGRAAIGVVFTILTSLSIPLLWRTLRALRASPEKASLLAVLFAVIPAVNIYGAVSLDAIVMLTSTVFLLGLALLMRDDAWSWPAFWLFAGGALASNALNFGSLFLLAVAAAFAVRRPAVRRALALTVPLGVLCYVILRAGFGYDHVTAFLNASRIENPDGFRAFAAPAHYWLTRLENVGNLAFFLSVPVLAALIGRRPRPITLVALAVLVLMFLAGVYRTGETARACLFVYPFLFLSLTDLPEPFLRWLIPAAGIQTIIMQVVGNFSW